AFVIHADADTGPGTAAGGASQRLISNPSRFWPRSSAATATTARLTANAKREFLPGCTSARPRAARHKAVTGFMAAKPQVDNSRSPAQAPMSEAAAMVTAAKPAT